MLAFDLRHRKLVHGIVLTVLNKRPRCGFDESLVNCVEEHGLVIGRIVTDMLIQLARIDGKVTLFMGVKQMRIVGAERILFGQGIAFIGYILIQRVTGRIRNPKPVVTGWITPQNQ